MRRLALLVTVLAAVVVTGCVMDNQTGPDATTAEPADLSGLGSGSGFGSGSGSDIAMVIEETPRDRGLEAMSGALGLVIVLGPIGMRRRRPKS